MDGIEAHLVCDFLCPCDILFTFSFQSLLNTVEISSGLPSQVTDSISQRPALDEEDERVKDVIRDMCMFDAVQKKLPKRTQVPYIGKRQGPS